MENEKLSSLISLVYDAALDRTLWSGVLEHCCRFIGGSGGNLFFYDNDKLPKGIFVTCGHDPAFQKLYNEKYTKMNPLAPGITFHQAGTVVSQSDLVSYDEMRHTRFFQEWMQPQGIVDILFGILEKSALAFGLLAIRRYERDGLVDDEMRYRMALLVPHLRRAVSIAICMELQRQTSSALEETLDGLAAGILLVGPDASIKFANAKARSILAENRILRNRHGVLAAVCSTANQTLRTVFAVAGRGDRAVDINGIAVPLLPADSNETWIAHILPLTSGARRQMGNGSAVATVFIRKVSLDSASALESVSKLYKLTISEVRVLQAIVDIGGVAAVAETLGVSEATVKTHLRNLFQKTGTSRQAELVKLVAGIISPLAVSF